MRASSWAMALSIALLSFTNSVRLRSHKPAPDLIASHNLPNVRLAENTTTTTTSAHPQWCSNCTWKGTNEALWAAKPAQRVQDLIVEVAEARQRLEEKIRILQSLQEAINVAGVQEDGPQDDAARGRAQRPLSDLTVQNYRSFFANASNARYLFGVDSQQTADTTDPLRSSADASAQDPIAGRDDVSGNGLSLLQIGAEQSLHQASSSAHGREIPYQNLWDFHGVPGTKCEAKCMAAWVKMRAACVPCLNGYHACTQSHILDAISSTTFHNSIHDVCQNLAKPFQKQVPEWPLLKGGCCSFDFEACPPPICLVEEMPSTLKED